MTTMTDLIARANDDAVLLGQFFMVKHKLEDKGYKIRADSDMFRVFDGEKVVFLSDEPLDINEWAETAPKAGKK